MMDLYTSALAVLMTLSPPTAPHEVLPGWAESPEARATRYESIAADVAAAVHDACVLRAPGDDGKRERCERWNLKFTLAVAFHESGFAPDVDKGPCYHQGKWALRCDSGRAKTMFQHIVYGAEADKIVADRKAATTRTIDLLEQSRNACRSNVPSEQLAAYTGGKCEEEMARQRSREIDGLAQRIERILLALPAPVPAG